MSRRTAVVIAPGRGVYNASELGYFNRFHQDKSDLIKGFDAVRAALGQESLERLDGAARYAVAKFTRGDNASGLIYTCSYADFLDIDRDAFDIVAATGNSMGWYSALACAGALSADNGFHVVNTMGAIMQDALIGGQMIYPFVDEDWREIDGGRHALLKLIDETPGLYVSIHLGGMLVLAGTPEALDVAEKRLPRVQERYPMRLANHAAFHTKLQRPTAEKGRATLPASLFQQPQTPLIDGRGAVWLPKACDLNALWSYTLGAQVIEPYDFTRAITVAMREFAPDVFILLGPGMTLGGATAQSMIADGWRGLASKSDFIDMQKKAPRLLAMGAPEQRGIATNGAPQD
ncbi:MAG: ACP S-malonyltransferase [Pseudomonadota bacterium]